MTQCYEIMRGSLIPFKEFLFGVVHKLRPIFRKRGVWRCVTLPYIFVWKFCDRGGRGLLFFFVTSFMNVPFKVPFNSSIVHLFLTHERFLSLFWKFKRNAWNGRFLREYLPHEETCSIKDILFDFYHNDLRGSEF